MKSDCNTIRREIDEADLNERLTVEINDHLSRCEQCRRFHNDRRTLRSLMAELETVGAPADFDFRLRARLARERPSNGFGSSLLTARPLAAIALLVVIVLGLVVLKNRWSMTNPPLVNNPTLNDNRTVAVVQGAAPTPDPVSKGSPSPRTTPDYRESPKPDAGKQQTAIAARNAVAQKGSNSSVGNVPRFRIRESAITGSEMIAPDPFSGLVIVPVHAREFRVSIDNGRGGARMISLPPVTFGSQRLLAREASFVPASSSRGDW